jgi:hypothetical protein
VSTAVAVVAVGTASAAAEVDEVAVQQVLHPAVMQLEAIPGAVVAEQLGLGKVAEGPKPWNLMMRLLAVRQYLA